MSRTAASGIDGRTSRNAWPILIAVVFAVFALTLLFTKRPWVDEAWFTGPAQDLVTRGKFGTLLLDPAGSHLRLNKSDAILQGINEHTYWVLPFHLLQLAAWGKLFGFSIFSMRMPSVLWGGVALASTGFVIRRLAGNGSALITAAVLAIAIGFVNAASDARMDMTCAALGLAALAVYLWLREVNLRAAVLCAHTLAAAGVFTHPNGAFGAGGLLIAMLWLDRHRLRPFTVAWLAAPYLLFGMLWAAYVMQAPADFSAQMSANTAARGSDILAPWRGIWREINGRYRTEFWPEGSTTGKLKIVGLLCYLSGFGTLAFARTLRQSSGCRLLLCLTVFQFLCLSVLASTKNTYYLVYILPYFAGAVGIASVYLWTSYGTRIRIVCAAALVAYAAVQTAAVLNLGLITGGYRKEYIPATAYLKSILQPDDLIMGAAELGYSLGFDNPQVVDDVWLGRWSGRRPTLVVVDRWYYQQVIDAATDRGVPAPAYFDTLLKSFRLVRESKGYRIYKRI